MAEGDTKFCVSGDGNVDWQTTRPCIRERNAFMFNNSLMSDVTFTMKDPETDRTVCVPAHKYVLGISSPVFFAMFYSDIAEKKDSIDLPDCHVNSFLKFLRCLYSDDVELTSSTVLEVLYLAKKYIVPSLTEKCIDYLERELNSNNVFDILKHGQRFDEKALVAKCWQIIDINITDCILSEGMQYIDRECLISLLKRDTLEIREIELFRSVRSWAETRCREKKVEPTGAELRKKLGDAVFHFRFSAMTQKEFAQDVVTSGILTDSEIVPIFMSFSNVTPAQNQFSQHPRTGILDRVQNIALLRCARFKNTGAAGDYASRAEILKFNVSASICLCGARLYAGTNEASEYEVNLELTQNGSQRNFIRGTFKTQSSARTPGSIPAYGFDVLFARPSMILPAFSLALHVNVHAIGSARVSRNGFESCPEVTVNGIRFTFYGDSNHVLELLFKVPRP